MKPTPLEKPKNKSGIEFDLVKAFLFFLFLGVGLVFVGLVKGILWLVFCGVISFVLSLFLLYFHKALLESALVVDW